MGNRTKAPKTLKNNIRPRCVVCGKGDSDRAHIKTRGSGAGWSEDEYLYLCRGHHMEQGHLNWSRFCEKYPTVSILLGAKGWSLVDEFGTWKLRRIRRKIDE